MKTLSVEIPCHTKTYPISIGTNILSHINELLTARDYTQIMVLTDSVVEKEHLKSLQSMLDKPTTKIVIPTGEKNKDIETVQTIWSSLLHLHADRKTLLINLGGGVVGDMGGFAAATYMRGIGFVQIPTTLLSMVDASIGGKTGVNFEATKNIIGAFAQPVAIIMDISLLETLPARTFRSGFAEIIKHGLIADADYVTQVTKKKPKDFSQNELIKIIQTSCHIKAQIVERDEKESGPRKLLNFGHTIGHAIETLSHETKHPLLHGEAIAVGLVGEAKLSEEMGYLHPEDVQYIEHALSQAGLPTRAQGMDLTLVREKMQDDKKNTHGKLKWTLLRTIGEADYNIQCGDTLVEKALAYVL